MQKKKQTSESRWAERREAERERERQKLEPSRAWRIRKLK